MSSHLNVSSTPIYRVNCNGTDVKTVITNGTINFLRPIKTYGAQYTEFDLADGSNFTYSALTTGSEPFGAILNNGKSYLKIQLEIPVSVKITSLYIEWSITPGWTSKFRVLDVNSSHSTLMSQTDSTSSPFLKTSSGMSHSGGIIIEIGQWTGSTIQPNWGGSYRIEVNGCPIYMF